MTATAMLNIEEMTAKEHADQALVFLRHSEEEFSRGDSFQASEKLWGAATQAVLATMDGKAPRTHREMKRRVRMLANKHNNPELRSGFAIAESFHSNFYHGWMEDFQMKDDAPLVHEFVHRLIAIYRNSGS